MRKGNRIFDRSDLVDSKAERNRRLHWYYVNDHNPPQSSAVITIALDLC